MKTPTWRVSAALSAGLTLLLLGNRSRADDSAPPCWRGNAGTTYENWSFPVSDNPAAPDAFTNPNGTPSATLTVGTFGTGWKASALGRTGLWDLGQSGQATLAVPNFGGLATSWKYVQVQVTYFDAPGFYLAPTTVIAGATLVSSTTVSNMAFGPGVWRTQITKWSIQPAPLSETVVITGDPSKGLAIDQVIVDTRSTAPADGDVAAFRPCWRGQAGSTFQQWLFGVSNNPAAIPAELVTNAFGAPQASIVAGAFSSGYISEDPFLGCRQGIWDLGQFGTMTLAIPNTPSGPPGSYKYVRVQVTQYRDGLYNANATVAIAGGTLVSQQQQTIETTTFGGTWVVAQSIWRLGPPCPSSESVVVTSGANGSLIDQAVVDTLCLDFTCPSDLVVTADAGQCSRSNVTFTLPAVNGCTITNVTATPPSGSTFPVGTNLVTLVITDGEGGNKTCLFHVIVLDNQAPTVACPANIIAPKDPAQCGAFVTFAATPFDNCPGATAGCNPPSGSLFPLGVTTVTCTATDAVGNVSAPCTFTVRVIDFNGDLAAFRPCWRGQAGSTFQEWAFSVSNNPAAIPAELVTNIYGAPIASLAPGPFSAGYINSDAFLGCRQGIWDLGRSGTMTFAVPNAPSGSAGSYKYVQVQVTQYRDALYNQNAAVTIAGATLLSTQQQTVETTTFGGTWVVQQTTWRLGPPCPSSESVVLTSGTNGSLIDQAVVDTICLDFPCPSDIIAAADLGQCSKSNVTWTVLATNGCTVTNVTSTPPIGSTFPVGTNLVTTVIQDSQGGSRTCIFKVIILDTQPPTVVCPANIIAAKDPSQCGAFVTFAATPFDNCPGATAGCNPPSGSLFPLGVTTVTCTATDAVGNVSAPCTFTVRVIDLNGDLAAFRPCWRGQAGSTFQEWAFSVSNNPAAIPAELVTNIYGTPVASIVPGPFSAGYINSDAFLGCRQGIWDLGQSGTLSLGIPNTPSGSASSYKYVRVQVTQYRDALYNANAAVTIAGAVLVSQQQQTVETTTFGGTWVVAQTIWRLGPPCPSFETVVCTAGTNGSLIDQAVVDTLCLDFPCPSNLAFNNDPGQCSKSNVTWSVPAVNGCTITNVTSTPPSGSTFPVGTNLVTTVISDGEGGTKTCNFTVTVTDNQPPVAACRNITVNLNAGGVATITGADVDNGSTDNCGIASRNVVPSSFTCANLGPNPVVLTVTDVHGLIATCNAIVTVQDLLPPVITCPLSFDTNATVGCSQVVTFPDPVVSDNCTVTNVTCTPPSGSTFPVGLTVVNCVVRDSSGNSANCSFSIKVIAVSDVSVAMAAAPSPAGVGSNITYTVTISNAGPCTATSVVLSNFFSAGQIGTLVTNDGGPGQACPNPGPAAWWKAEGNASDSADSHNGTAAGGVAYVAGVVGQAFSFDGLSGRVSVPDSPGLRPAALTLEGWINAHDVTGTRVVISKRVGAGSVDSFSLYVSAGRIYAGIGDNIGSGPLVSAVFATPNQWFHVAYNFDPATQVQALYLNGALVDAGFVTRTIAYDAHAVLIGADDVSGSPGLFFKGEIDELSVYNRALSGTEIEAVYLAGGNGKCGVPGRFLLGDLPMGAATQVKILATPTQCPSVSTTVSAASSSVDPSPANNASTVTVPILPLPADDLVSTIDRIGGNVDRVRLSWPLVCGPYILESTPDITPPSVWTTVVAPLQVIDNLHVTILPATDAMKYFRVRVP